MIDIPSWKLTLSFQEVCAITGYTPSTCRRLIAAGKLPSAIDLSVSPKLRRWSRALIEDWAAGGVAVDSDPTPAFGIVRPDLSAVAS